MNLDWVERRRRLRAARGGVGQSSGLWPMWMVALLAIALAGAGGWALYQWVLGSSAVRGATPVDVVRTTLSLMAAFGIVLTGVYAYRKQLLSEADTVRADAAQLTQRYGTAAEQLGHDKAAVRLAGAYAMARLADDWPRQRQQCVDVLCAYLRMSPEPDSGASETEVRATIVRLIAAHLRDDSVTSWVEQDFDFTAAMLHDADFNGVVFSGRGISFANATFSGRTTFYRARFSGMVTRFDGATFSGKVTIFGRSEFSGELAWFDKVRFSADFTSFDGATFSGEDTMFDGSTFSGDLTSFDGATFSGEDASFDSARFSGKETSFDCATFSGTETNFGTSSFSADRTRFDRATFAGDLTNFDGAMFSGDLTSFDQVTFSGDLTSFDEATFQGAATSFDEATFQGTETSFDGATFRGETTADEATLTSSFLGPAVQWGPLSPRTLPSAALGAD